MHDHYSFHIKINKYYCLPEVTTTWREVVVVHISRWKRGSPKWIAFRWYGKYRKSLTSGGGEERVISHPWVRITPEEAQVRPPPRVMNSNQPQHSEPPPREREAVVKANQSQSPVASDMPTSLNRTAPNHRHTTNPFRTHHSELSRHPILPNKTHSVVISPGKPILGEHKATTHHPRPHHTIGHNSPRDPTSNKTSLRRISAWHPDAEPEHHPGET